MIKVCDYCGLEYKAEHSRRKYCSFKCYSEDKKKSATKLYMCTFCGKELYRKNHQENRSKKRRLRSRDKKPYLVFCNTSCAKRYWGRKKFGIEINPSDPTLLWQFRETVTCSICGKKRSILLINRLKESSGHCFSCAKKLNWNKDTYINYIKTYYFGRKRLNPIEYKFLLAKEKFFFLRRSLNERI